MILDVRMSEVGRIELEIDRNPEVRKQRNKNLPVDAPPCTITRIIISNKQPSFSLLFVSNKNPLSFLLIISCLTLKLQTSNKKILLTSTLCFLLNLLSLRVSQLYIISIGSLLFVGDFVVSLNGLCC